MKKYIAFIVQKLGHCIKFIKYIYNLNLYRNNNNKIEKYLQYMQTKGVHELYKNPEYDVV